MKRIFSVLLLLLSIVAQAQVGDYFPEGYFADGRCDDDADVVVHYMRLAGAEPLWDSTTAKGTTLLRLTLLPKYYHPLFVTVTVADSGAALVWRKGNAKHWLDHAEGILDSGRRLLSPSETDTLRSLMATALPLPRKHCSLCSSTFQPPYLLEAVNHRGYSAYYDECYFDVQGRLANAIVALADSLYLDMEIHTPDNRTSIQPPQFPGGEEAMKSFIDSLLVYPPEALRELEGGTVTLRFVVERDGSLHQPGSLSDDDHGLSLEAIRVFRQFPRWQPAMKDGKPVRSYASASFRFVVPDSLLPAYGNPVLETPRDRDSWHSIYGWYKCHYLHPDQMEPCYNLAACYYDEFMLPRVPVEQPSALDTFLLDMGGDSTFSYNFDRTPVVASPADSALRYYYMFLERLHAAVDIDSLARRGGNGYVDTLNHMLNAYLPIRRLERHLGLPHNPLNRLPLDTLLGYHYPRSYFCDNAADTLPDTYSEFEGCNLGDSYFWTRVFSDQLNQMDEPVLFSRTLEPSDTVLRFAFYPSFHPPLAFRIEKHGASASRRLGDKDETIVLYWKQLEFSEEQQEPGDDTLSIFDFAYHLREGHRTLSRRQYRRLMNLFQPLHFDRLPRTHTLLILDGAQWVIERRTADTFKAYYTNVAGSDIADLYDYLISLARIKAKYAREYCD